MEMIEFLDKIDFEKGGGLVPCIVQDSYTRENLMLAYMDRDALQKTLQTKKATFFSRSRNRLWVKGESQGVYLPVVSVRADCDGDTILLQVKSHILYNACHLGRRTCWGDPGFSLEYLDSYINGIDKGDFQSGYTWTLLDAGTERCAQKVGEEAIETLIEAIHGSDERLISESADLLYHLLVLLRSRDLSLADVISELESRHSPK